MKKHGIENIQYDRKSKLRSNMNLNEYIETCFFVANRCKRFPCLWKLLTSGFSTSAAEQLSMPRYMPFCNLYQTQISVNGFMTIKAMAKKQAVSKTRCFVKTFPWAFFSGRCVTLSRCYLVSSHHFPFSSCYLIIHRRTIGWVFHPTSSHNCLILEHFSIPLFLSWSVSF